VTTQSAPPADVPYVGPRAIPAGRKLYGRDVDIQDLLDLLIPERVVLFYSPSGAGKTSLIQAGLIPELESKHLIVRGPIRVNLASDLLPEVGSSVSAGADARMGGAVDGEPVGDVDPGAPRADGGPHDGATVRYPNRYVLSTLLSLDERLPAHRRRSPEELARLDLVTYLNETAPADEPRRPEVLLFDQFEEIITLDPIDTESKEELFRQVGEALDDPWRWALFSMREDYIAELDPYLSLLPTRLRTRFRLDLLEKEAALEAIQGPAADANYTFTDEAARQLVDDLSRVRVSRPGGEARYVEGRYVEPVQLQVVCLRIWQQPRSGTVIETSDVASLGSVDRALGDYYAECVEQVAGETGVSERAIRAWVEEKLITPNGLRFQVIEGTDGTLGMDNAVLAGLTAVHLLRRDEHRGIRWYELAHDRLVQPLQESNAAWRADHLSLLEREADVWARHGRADHLLVSGAALEEMEQWADEHPHLLGEVEHAFLAECRQMRDEEVRRAELEETRRRLEEAEREKEAGRLREELSAAEIERAKAEADRASAEAKQAEIEARRVRLRFKLVLALVGVIATCAVILAGMGVVTYSFGTKADEKERQANIALSERLSAQVEGLLPRYDLALLLAVEAQTRDDSAMSRGSLLSALANKPRLTRFLPGHPGLVSSVAISPDGRLIAVGSQVGEGDSERDGSVQLWDAATGSRVGPLLPGHAWGLAFSPDGQRLASGRQDGAVGVWDLSVAPARELPRLSGVHQDAVTSVVFSTDGRQVASADRSGAVVVWDVEQGRPAVAPFRVDTGEAWGVALSPDGRRLGVGRSDGWITVWDVATRADVLRVRPDRLWVRALTFTPAGDRLMSAGASGVVRVWDVSPGRPASDMSLMELPTESRNTILGLAVSRDGSRLAASGVDGLTTIWDLASGTRHPALTGHTDWVWSVAFGPDSRTVVTGSNDRSAIVWDLDARWGRALAPRAQGPLRTIALSPDDTVVAAAGDGRQIMLWETAIGQVLPSLPEVHRSTIRSLAFSPDGTTLVSGGNDNLVLFWDWRRGVQLPHIVGHGGSVAAVAFRPGTNVLASASCEQGPNCPRTEIRLSDGGTGRPVDDRLVIDREGGPWSLAFSPDGRHLAVGIGFSNIYLFDFSTGATPARLPELAGPRGHRGQVYSLGFSPDGRTLVSASADGRVILWDVASQRWLSDSLVGTGRSVWGVAFQPPDGLLFAIANGDGSISLRNAQGGDRVGPFLGGHGEGARGVTFNRDGSLLASTGLDGQVVLWDSSATWNERACQVANRNLTAEEWRKYLGDRPYRETCAGHVAVSEATQGLDPSRLGASDEERGGDDADRDSGGDRSDLLPDRL
jgi:WD40 repeat protein